VTREMTLDALGQKAFASALTTARERSASALGPHPRSKTVLTFAGPFRWLISAFHKAEKSAPRELRAVTLGWSPGLSTELAARISILEIHWLPAPSISAIKQ
jgi:hypothetical protein